MKKGDLVLIPFPFTDLSGNKNRPAVVLALTDLDVTVSFITSQIKWQEKFDVVLNHSSTNGLKVKYIIRLNKLATIDKDLVIGKLGNLTDTELIKINKSLSDLFEI